MISTYAVILCFNLFNTSINIYSEYFIHYTSRPKSVWLDIIKEASSQKSGANLLIFLLQENTGESIWLKRKA